MFKIFLFMSSLMLVNLNLIHCEDECGVTYVSQNAGKIVGGSVATAHSWPASAYIQFNYKKDVTHDGTTWTEEFGFMCGGTLIKRNVILTAAHCIAKTVQYTYDGVDYTIDVEPNSYYPTEGSMYTVYLGYHDLTDIGSSSTGVDMSVSEVIMHEEYDESNTLNDIAILKLSQEVTLTQNIQIACIPTESSSSYPGTNLDGWIVGWGTTSFGGSTSDLLKNAKINIYPSSSCSSVLTSYTKNWNAQICAGEIAGGEDTCQGDSGGSLYSKEVVDGVEKFVSVGIVSYGEGCADPNLPGIYTRVSYYYEWIKKNNCSKNSVFSLSILISLIIGMLNLFF